MPDLAAFHPQIVHFVIAFLILGVVARVLSLLPLGDRFKFVGPMATVLLILGTLAAIAAFKSGMDAHGPVERVPGARNAVTEHEDWGGRTRNLFIAIAVLELAALALVSRRGLAQGVRVVSALAGLAGLFVLYEASEHGGDLVYNYAGFIKKYPDTYWEGGMFVFDERRAVNPNSKEELKHIAHCHFCGKLTSYYINCHNVDCDKIIVSCHECKLTNEYCCSDECRASVNKRKVFHG